MCEKSEFKGCECIYHGAFGFVYYSEKHKCFFLGSWNGKGFDIKIEREVVK